MDINMVTSSSTDHRSLLRRLNPESEPFFISDILLLLRVGVILWLDSMSGGRIYNAIHWQPEDWPY